MNGVSEFTTRLGAIFLQRDGPNTPLEYVGVHGVEGLSAGGGGAERGYVLDQHGNYIVQAEMLTPPSDVSYNIIGGHTVRASVFDDLAGCKFNLYAAYSKCGRPSNFRMYDAVLGMLDSSIGDEDFGNVVAFDTDERIRFSRSVTASPPLLKAWELQPQYLTASNVMSATGEFYSLAPCRGNLCGRRGCRSSCGRVYAVVHSGTQHGNVVYMDRGGTWKQVPARPFAGTLYEASLITCLDSGRIVVAHTATTVGGKLGFSYSDDAGYSWVDYIPNADEPGASSQNWSIFSLGNTVWVGSVAGYIYRSIDGGETWEVPEAGVISSTPYLGIVFLNENEGYAVGDGVLVKSADGGETWTEIDAPDTTDMKDVWVTEDYLWVVGAKAWYRERGGTEWFVRRLPLSFPTTDAPLTKIRFYNDYVGAILQAGLSGTDYINRIYYTVTGGAENTWKFEDLGVGPPEGSLPGQRQDSPGGESIFVGSRNLQDLQFCGEHSIFSAGEDALAVKLSAFK